MSTDWREKEREFLTGLEPDTGRDLGEWMRVIAAQNLPHRNDIIDWLRQQGFTFARASWLERIHHNAGRPIYLDAAWSLQHDAAATVETIAEEPRLAMAGGGGRVLIASPITACAPAPQSQPQSLASAPLPTPSLVPPPTSLPSPVAALAEPALHATSQAAAGPHLAAGAPPASTPHASARPAAANPPSQASRFEIDEVLAKAKAYRPLAALLLRQIEAAVPDAVVTVGPSHLILSRAADTFALLAISGKDLRLALPPAAALEGEGDALLPAKLPVTLAKAAQGLSYMLVLTDARQVDGGLVNLVKRAARV